MDFTVKDGVLRHCTEKKGVTEVDIPDYVTKIGDFSFYECKNLQRVYIPKSVTKIGCRAFYGCEHLTSVTIPEHVMRIGDGAFEKCTDLTSVTIPEGVKHIENETFDGCRSLTTVMIPKTVKSIGDHAFRECKSLRNVILPEHVTSIGRKSFCECRSLKNMTIPDSVTWIGNGAFDGCRSIRLFGIEFTPKAFRESDYTNARKMIKTRDFSMKISTDIKYAAAVGFWLETGDEVAEAFLKKSVSRIMPFLIEHGNADAIGKLLESGKFITKKNIDKFIGCAIEHTQNGGNIEIQTQLLHYKGETIGYKDPEKQFRL